MSIQSELDKALAAYEPKIAEQIVSLCERRFSALVRAFGDNRFKGVYNTTYATMFKDLLPLMRYEQDMTASEASRTTYPPRVLDEAKVAKYAAAQAHLIAESWKAKIMKKVGELASPEVHRLDGYRFHISGRRGEDRVSIEQSMIINVSSKGTLFNQFPARIKVNGKSISEKRYSEGVK